MIKVRLISNPERILEVDPVHFDTVLRKSGKYEVVPKDEPRPEPVKISFLERILRFFMEIKV